MSIVLIAFIVLFHGVVVGATAVLKEILRTFCFWFHVRSWEIVTLS